MVGHSIEVNLTIKINTDFMAHTRILICEIQAQKEINVVLNSGLVIRNLELRDNPGRENLCNEMF